MTQHLRLANTDGQTLQSVLVLPVKTSSVWHVKTAGTTSGRTPVTAPHCQLDASNGSQFSNHRSQGRSRLRSQEVVDYIVTLSDPHDFYLMENFRLKS